LPDFDFQVSMLSLAHIFGTTLETIPNTVPYLLLNEQTTSRWRARLPVSQEIKVGIVWQGRPQHANDRFRSIPLASFESLGRISGVRIYSLQKDAGREQLSLPRSWEIDDLAPQLTDLAETAGAMQHLDVVVTCDSAPAHLAGALGLPVWIAIPAVPDWRWLQEREDSPWYPTARLFRQRERGNWTEVFAQIALALQRLCDRDGIPPRQGEN
jgi:hypothetical protein